MPRAPCPMNSMAAPTRSTHEIWSVSFLLGYICRNLGKNGGLGNNFGARCRIFGAMGLPDLGQRRARECAPPGGSKAIGFLGIYLRQACPMKNPAPQARPPRDAPAPGKGRAGRWSPGI